VEARAAAAAALAVLALAGCGGDRHPPARTAVTPRRTPAPRTDAAAIAARAHVPVLCYHQIRPLTSQDGAQARPYIVDPRSFARQMAALDRAGYTTVSGAALVDHLARGAPLPPKPVLLSFDDASAGQWTTAVPILRRHHFTATFFVMTVVLDKPGWLTRREVKAIDRRGMEIAAHTWDHKAVPEYQGADWAKQLGEPKLELTKLLGHPVHLFAYPFGLWDRRAFPNLRRVGFRAAFQLAEKADPAEPLLTIRRIIVPAISGRRLLHEMRTRF
jgi:peptidoglycan/xylan/chitin deacetylase (PgdA/CDA1 family)